MQMKEEKKQNNTNKPYNSLKKKNQIISNTSR